ncbi:MAG: type II toxin-antitoxin system prevent-host-death family antitoxin [Rhizobium sp.]|nr:MAG: type II toxin-antitoxin system prevent-host-death family antitoxin [Rhizobium sp.]
MICPNRPTRRILRLENQAEEIALQKFTASELHSNTGEVCEASFRGPVEIIKNNRRKFVILAATDYDALMKKAEPTRAAGDSHA